MILLFKSFAVIVALIVIFLGIIIMAKNNNTLKNRQLIIDAISLYHEFTFDVCCFDNCNPFSSIEVDFSDMEPYLKTLFRVHDWGYSKILPPNKMEIIKPFLKTAKKNK